MKFRLVSLLFVGILFGLASVASADIILNIGFAYQTAFDALDQDIGPGTSSTTGVGATTHTDVQINPLAAYYRFNVYVSVSGLASDQDIVALQWNGVTTGAVQALADRYLGNEYSVNPAKMPAGTGSDAPNHQWDNLDFFNGTAFVVDMFRGTTSTGNGNGTYGDYAAYMQMGEATSVNATGPFNIGQMDLIATAPGTFGFSFHSNPNFFKVINANTNGLGVLANESYPTYSGVGDSVTFYATPEPSTLALLGCGLFGLLAYAWRKRK